MKLVTYATLATAVFALKLEEEDSCTKWINSSGKWYQPESETHFSYFDTDGSGVVTWSELKAFIDGAVPADVSNRAKFMERAEK